MFPLIGGKIGSGFFLLPIVFALQVIMNVGIALLVATYVTLVPDGQNVMSFVQRILFFVTPVIYPVALLPANVKPFIAWQPLFPLFACYQAIFSGQTPERRCCSPRPCCGPSHWSSSEAVSSYGASASSPSRSDRPTIERRR